jgi:hypothetical protein
MSSFRLKNKSNLASLYFQPAVEPLEDRLALSSPRDVLIALEGKLNASINKGVGYSYSTDSGILAWGESYILSSYVQMYRDTGNTAYLDNFMYQANRVLANARDVVGNGYLGWASTRYSTDQSLTEYMVHDAMITAPMAEFAYVIHGRSVLQSKFGASANTYVNFIENEILPKWDPYYQMISDVSGTYIFPYDNSTSLPGNSVPHNWNAAMGTVYLWLYGINGNSDFYDRATQLATTFKNNLSLQDIGPSYVWNYADPLLPGDTISNQIVEDTSHANQEIAFATLAYRMGIVFNGADMQYFENTLTQVMWNQSINSPVIRSQVNGGGGSSYMQYLGQWSGLASIASPTTAFSIWQIATAVYQQNKLWTTASAPTEMLTISQLINILPKDGQALRNGNFETTGSWLYYRANSGVAFRSHAQFATGSYGLTVSTINPLLGTHGMQQSIYYLPGSPINVSFSGRTNGISGGGRLQIIDVTANKVLANVDFVNTGWQTFTATVNPPVQAGHNIQIRLLQINSTIKGAAAYFDDVSVTQ